MYTVRIVGKCLSKFSLAAFLLSFLSFLFIALLCKTNQRSCKLALPFYWSDEPAHLVRELGSIGTMTLRAATPTTKTSRDNGN